MKEKEIRTSPRGIKQGRTKENKQWKRLCKMEVEGCPNYAQDAKTKKCSSCGGGNRCIVEGCPRSAQDYKTNKCISCGGGNRCIYIVGFLKYDPEFEFPPEMELTKTVTDCLKEGDVADNYVYTQDSKIYKHLVVEVVKKGVVYQWRRKYVRANKSGVCPTLTANMGTGGHNVPIILDKNGNIRKLTPRECFNIQGYPPSFILPPTVSNTQLYKQAGNSVSVPVIKRIAEEIHKVLLL